MTDSLTCPACGQLTKDGDHCQECKMTAAEIAWDEQLDDVLLRSESHG